MRYTRFCAAILVCVLCAMQTSCKGRPKLFPVRGKVICQEMNLEGAVVTLHPMGAPSESAPCPQGVVGKDGSFQISTYAKNDGAPSGQYRVTIALEVIEPGGDRDEANIITPGKYASPDTTEFTIDVKELMGDLEPFVIKCDDPEEYLEAEDTSR
jgi:hypothetical protein